MNVQNHAELDASWDDSTIADAIRCLQEIAQGHYNVEPNQEGPLAGAVRELSSSLRKRASKELKCAVKLSQGASESMAAVSFVAGGVREALQNTQIISSSVEELNAAIAEIAKVSNLIADDAGAVRGSMTSALSAVESAVTGMGNISSVVNETSGKMTLLNNASQEIGDIIEAIEAIAKQTNLLALNATIEAARAGEAGKGFAVVAGEVKALANQTAAATDKIRSQIGNIRSEMTAIVEGITKTTKVVAEGSASIEQVGEEIRGIVPKIEEVTARVSENAGSVTEQNAATQEVARSVEIISQKASQSAAHAEKAIDAVAVSEKVLQEQFNDLGQLDIPGATIQLAKSDHTLWKKKLAEMLVGHAQLDESELKDHHQCRLGKWYYALEDRRLLDHPAYKALEDPHARVHVHARKVYELFSHGDREAAESEYGLMSAASEEVLSFLEALES